MRSQENTVSFCPGFNEPLCCEHVDESMWPHQICRMDFSRDSKINLKKFKAESISHIMDYNQKYGIDDKCWEDAINQGSSAKEIRKNLETMFSKNHSFFYRWNQSSFYFYDWCNQGENYFWISVIRNPMDRACSSFQKHRWSLSDSLKNTRSFASKIEEIKDHERFLLIYYEELIHNPEKTIQKIYNLIGQNNVNINTKNIIGSNGKPFRPQTSLIKDVYSKEDGYLTEAEEFSGFYDSQQSRYQTDCWAINGKFYRLFGDENYNAFKKELSSSSIYSRYYSENSKPIPVDIDFKYACGLGGQIETELETMPIDFPNEV